MPAAVPDLLAVGPLLGIESAGAVGTAASRGVAHVSSLEAPPEVEIRARQSHTKRSLRHKTGGLALRGESSRSRMRNRLETARNAALLPKWSEMVRRSRRRENRGLGENASF